MTERRFRWHRGGAVLAFSMALLIVTASAAQPPRAKQGLQ